MRLRAAWNLSRKSQLDWLTPQGTPTSSSHACVPSQISMGNSLHELVKRRVSWSVSLQQTMAGRSPTILNSIRNTTGYHVGLWSDIPSHQEHLVLLQQQGLVDPSTEKWRAANWRATCGKTTHGMSGEESKAYKGRVKVERGIWYREGTGLVNQI